MGFSRDFTPTLKWFNTSCVNVFIALFIASSRFYSDKSADSIGLFKFTKFYSGI
jgi:hypothetical protein